MSTVDDPSPSSRATVGGIQFDRKIERQMLLRGWTSEQVDRAILSGPRIAAVNRANGAAATRYLHPVTGQSVVVEDASRRIVQVGGPGFRFGSASGDVPGALLRPAPVAQADPGSQSRNSNGE